MNITAHVNPLLAELLGTEIFLRPLVLGLMLRLVLAKVPARLRSLAWAL